MANSYTLKQLTEVKDSAPDFGLGEVQETRFAAGELDAEDTGVSHQRIKPNQRVPFAHVHENAEEVYVVLSGSGRAKLDDEIIDVAALDALRVAPKVTRNFEAGPEGLELLVFGPHHKGDGSIVQAWWTD
jgi:mannose-6-phosphate isomerase-like protein (cupin superfamily)